MPTRTEKAAFAARLRAVMRRESLSLEGPTALANWLKQRSHGAISVSPQTAHKWLKGATIPLHDTLVLFAELFDVDLHWLQYGPGQRGPEFPPSPQPATMREPTIPPAHAHQLLSRFESLDKGDRALVEVLISRLTSLPD
ncbi:MULTISPECIES: helix-turn-helix domain-containing protein [unclassified Paraburkholderia]|uniref:helix-turn-helix domain-containing protein n=1 Tax=unclassified Paraburkholderia TaxID=2615204 RepID=UPI001981BBB1|nr:MULTISPECIES: helix-turn-helix transcriptional regulator [unclassified Paraburkholderia]MBN3857767.1 helix-turn-helix transcriptional regulator [Paraburkholderia sp. Ac-20340]